MPARFVGTYDGNQIEVYKTYPVTNATTVSAGDFVKLVSGRVSPAATGDRILGVVDTTVTGNAAGTNKVMVIVSPYAQYVVTNDNLVTTFAASHVGQYFDIIGASGAQLIDTSTVSATTGSLVCLEYGWNGDLTKGVFAIVENQLTGNTN